MNPYKQLFQVFRESIKLSILYLGNKDKPHIINLITYKSKREIRKEKLKKLNEI